jgi:hypothetical protein
MQHCNAISKVLLRPAASLVLAASAFACSIVEVPLTVGRDPVISLTRNKLPVTDAGVVVYRIGHGSRMDRVVMRSVTGRQGQVRIRGLVPGSYVVSSVSEGADLDIGGFEVSPDVFIRNSEVNLEIPVKPVPPLPTIVSVLNATVFDPSGAVIPHVDVRASRSDGRFDELATFTDEKGTVHLPVPDGKYEVRFGIAGFATAVVPVEVSAKAEKVWDGFVLTMFLAECGSSSLYRYKITEPRTEE